MTRHMTSTKQSGYRASPYQKSDLHSPVGDVIEESLPDEPEEQPEEITKGTEPARSADEPIKRQNDRSQSKGTGYARSEGF